MTINPHAIAEQIIRWQVGELDSIDTHALALGYLEDVPTTIEVIALTRQIGELLESATVTVTWPDQAETASAEPEHLIHIDAGIGYKFRAICTCGHTTEWLFGPDRAVNAGQAHVAGVGAVAEVEQLRTQVNTARQALADTIRDHMACEVERDQARAEAKKLRAQVDHYAMEADEFHGLGADADRELTAAKASLAAIADTVRQAQRPGCDWGTADTTPAAWVEMLAGEYRSAAGRLPRFYTITAAARRLADIEAARTPATEDSSIWLEAHRAAVDGLRAALDGKEAGA